MSMPGSRYVTRPRKDGGYEVFDLHTRTAVAVFPAERDAWWRACSRCRRMNEAWDREPIPGYRADTLRGGS